MSDWIDITRPLKEGIEVYSEHEQFKKTRAHEVAEDGYQLTHFSMGAHCGTHMDAPAHFIEGGNSIENAQIQTLVGKCRIVLITGQSLLDNIPQATERLLLKTNNFKGLTLEMAQNIIDADVKLLGIDTMSVAPPDNESEIHKLLFGSGIWILENLDLSKTDQGLYELICLPLLLTDCEGAPCRAVVRRIDEE